MMPSKVKTRKLEDLQDERDYLDIVRDVFKVYAWTQGTAARLPGGEACKIDDPRATSFCLTGGTFKAREFIDIWSCDEMKTVAWYKQITKRNELERKALQSIRCAVMQDALSKDRDPQSPEKWNDLPGRRREQVMRILRKAKEYRPFSLDCPTGRKEEQ